MVTHHEVGEGSHNRDEDSDERRVVGTPPDLVETVRSLMVELQSCKADNERMIKEQEKQMEINEVLLQSLSDIQRKLCNMNLRHINEVMLVATLRGAPRERSTPEIRDKHRTILLERKLATWRDLLAAELVLIPEENERSRNFPRVIISKNSRRPNHPPSTVK
jgi:hypothetical protein